MERPRRRYERNRQRVRVLPAGMAETLIQRDKSPNGELIPSVCREIESVRPAGEIDVEAVCDRGIFCPLCSKRVEDQAKKGSEEKALYISKFDAY